MSEYQINSSALRRAFPNFSQYGSSEEDSIELGRGLKKSVRGTPGHGILSEDISEDLPFSLGKGDHYKVTGTPPLKPRSSAKGTLLSQKADFGRSTSHKENVDPLAKMTYVSGSSSKSSQNERQSLAEIHVRVKSDDSVQLTTNRPQEINNSTKGTRFTSNRNQPVKGTFDTKPTKSNATTLADLSNGQTAQQGLTTDSGINVTAQSFMLPDLPNITELVSGVRADGTPLFNRSSKPRSRFATPSQARRKVENKMIHIPIDSIPVPADEKALYLSLQLLQEKVANLEREKAESDKARDDYELEVLQLRSKLEEQDMVRQSDNTLEADVEDGKVRDWQGERSGMVSDLDISAQLIFCLELERSIRTLEDRLEGADRKVSVSKMTIRNLTQDRDAAHQQLAAAYLNSEELKVESDELQQELQNVKAELIRVTKSNERTMERLTQQEMELRQKIARREKAVNEMGALAKELWSTRNALAVSNKETSSAPVQRSESAKSLASSVKLKSADQQRWHSTQTLQASHEDADLSDADSTTDLRMINKPKHSQNQNENSELTKDSTYLSFMEGDEVSKLRRILEEDKAKLAKACGTERAMNGKAKVDMMPRKSSFRSLDAKSRNHRVQYEDDNVELDYDADEASQHPTEKHQHKDQSSISQRSEKRQYAAASTQPEITSAFIVEDITMNTLPTINVKVSGMTNAPSESSRKQTMVVTRPIPVSNRMPPVEEDPTVRPAQSPAIALAVVLKGLEDELTQLRSQLSAHQVLYHQHDPSLSKRKRKAVCLAIQQLLAAIELRADQIYALYDVLEGQKASGTAMQEEEVEVTLQNIGVGMKEAMRWTSATRQSTKTTGVPENLKPTTGYNTESRWMGGHEEESGEEDDELPWEGIEPTATQEIASLNLPRQRAAV